MSERSPKARIASATLALLRETGDPRAVTVRLIARRARVGTGLVNYHFQTKERLIDEAVRLAVGGVIEKWDEQVPRRNVPAVARLTRMLQAAASFLAGNPGVSRISIQYDLAHPAADDNTAATLSGLMPLLREAFGPTTDDARLRVVALQLVAPLQVAFLRGAVFRAATGVDFADAAERDAFVKRLVDDLVPTKTKKGRLR